MTEDPPDGASQPVVRRNRRNGGSDALGYEPSLDGLRAVAVVAVLFFHARFSWIPGGFLGVSTFFTLSGFLITSLMIKEWRRTGSVSLRGFFSRRFRRLLPASWFTLALVVAMGAVGIWVSEQLRSLRGDVPWALVELINWHFIAQGRDYGAQFATPSPLEHYWSLAIEQQFYLLLPLVVLGLLGWSQRRALARGGASAGPSKTPLRPLVVVLVIATIISWYLNWRFARTSVARSYFGTDTRLAELGVGALLACVGLQRLRSGSSLRRLVLATLGLVGLVASGVLWYTATVGSAWLYPWGLMATAAASAAMIAGALNSGILTWFLELAPVVALGRISYGVYLLHWPIFLWLTPTRVGWSQWPLFGLRMAVTLLGAVLMFRLLETPVRTGPNTVSRVAARMAAPAAVVILLATFLVTADLPQASELASASDRSTTTTAPPAPVRVLVVGDELAQQWTPLGTTASGETESGEPDSPGVTTTVTVPETGAPLEVTVAAAPNCGVALGGYVKLASGELERDTDRCGPVKDAWESALVASRPDVVLVWSGLRDVADRRLGPETPWETPGSPELDDFLSTEVRELVDRLSADGAAVVLGSTPYMRNTTPAPTPMAPVVPPDPVRGELSRQAWEDARVGIPPAGYAENDDARIDRWNELIDAAAAATGTQVIDLADAMAAWPGGQFDPDRRAADGVGLTELGIAELAEEVALTLEEAKPPTQRADPTAEVAAEAPLPPAPALTPRNTVAPGGTADVLVVGDSVAFNIGYGLDEWSDEAGGVRVQPAGQLGCPIARGGQFRFLRNIETFEDRCDWSEMFGDWIDSNDPEVVVLVSGIWEVVDRRLQGDDRFRRIGEPLVDRYILSEFLSAIDTLAARGANVVVLTYPHFEAGRDQGYSDLPESDPARVDRLNELLAEAVSMRPGVATLVDFQDWLAAQPGGELDPLKREDGLHFRDEYAPTIGAWLGPQLVDLARTGVPAPG
ncbi:MAG: acyltransferase family protein [Microthrixaceae bacterium]